MFDEVQKYKNNDHFFFEKGNNMSELAKDIPDKPGVYILYKLANGKVTLVYFGKSNTKNEKLRSSLISKQFYFENKIEAENIEALDIYWYVTIDKNNQDLPEFVEGLLLQRHFDIYKEKPAWNQEV